MKSHPQLWKQIGAHICVFLILFQSTAYPALALAQFSGAELSADEMAAIKGGGGSPAGAPKCSEATDHCPYPHTGCEQSGKDSEPSQDPTVLTGGKFFLPETDLLIPGPARNTGFNLRFERSYSSQFGYTQGVSGAGWFTILDIKLEDLAGAGAILVFRDIDGSFYSLLQTLPGRYEDGQTVAERNPDGTITLTKKFGTKYQFTAGSPSPGGIDHRIKEIEDRNGNKLIYTYPAVPFVGAATRLEDSAGNAIVFNYYGATGKVQNASDSAGRGWDYTYDVNGNLITATDSLGRTTTYGYDDPRFIHAITSVVDSLGRATTYEYDDELRVSRQTKPDGSIQNFTFNDFMGTSSMVDPGGNTWHFEYTADAQTTLVLDPENGVNSYTYDPSTKLMSSHTDALGRTETWAYDSKENIIQHTNAAGGTETFTYDPSPTAPPEVSHKWLTRTDENGHTTTRTLDAHGDITKVVDPMGGEMTFSYTPSGFLSSQTDRNGNSTTHTYDASGNLKATTDPLGNVTQFTYDNAGRISSITDAKGRVTAFKYDKGNRLLETTRPDGTKFINIFDKGDRLLSTTDPLGHITAYSYDVQDNLLTTSDALGNVTANSYDVSNNLISVIDALGRTSTFSYDKLNRRLTATDPLPATTSFEYDLAGNLLKITDARGNATQYQYDNLNRLTKRTYPDNSTEEVTYDAVGNMLAQKTRAGETISRAYDANDRMISKGCPSCGAGYAYDPEGNLLTMVDAVAGTFTYQYDELNRMTKSVQPGNQTVKYKYDPVGLRKKLIYPDNTEITYDYDKLNQLQRITDGTEEYNFNYDSANRRQALIYPNGIKTAYDYDNANRLIQVKTKNTIDDSLITRYDYTVDQFGNWTSMAVKIGGSPLQSHSYSYDTVDRLTSVSKPSINQTYAYDKVGNRVSKTENAVPTSYTANNLNQYAMVNTTTFTYDARGNLTGDGVLAMTYDTDNRLTQILKGGDAVNNTYDVTNRLISQTVNGVFTRFVYDGWDVIAEVRQNGNIKTKYIHGPRVDEILAQKKNNTLYLTRDGLGSTRELTKENGSISQRFDYDVFGAPIVLDQDGTAIPDAPKTNYLFTGRELQPETGLYNYRNRFYHPGLGRFVQPDPVAELDGLNIYEYADNGPITNSDPSGLSVWKLTYRIFTKGGRLVRQVRELQKAKALANVRKALDKAGPRSVIQAENVKGRDAIAKALSKDGKIRGPEKSPGFPEHVHPNSGEYTGTHVQTLPPGATYSSLIGGFITSTFVPKSSEIAENQCASPGEVAAAAAYDLLSGVDPTGVTDVVDWIAGD